MSEYYDPNNKQNSNGDGDNRPAPSSFRYGSSESDGSYHYYQPEYTVSPQPTGKQKKSKGNRRGLMAFAGVLASVFIVSVVGFATFAITDLYKQGLLGKDASTSGKASEDLPSSSSLDLALNPKPTTDATSQAPNGGYTATEVYGMVSPSVVGVTTYSQSQYYLEQIGAASGIVMTEDGYIITNAHVVAGASVVKILTNDGNEYPAKIIGTDSTTDIAVLKAEATGLTPASFGDSDEIQIGESVLAIGNPAGLSNSMTGGMVSGLNRRVSTDSGTSIYSLDSIQVDAAINPGNSGGALVNMFGQVIGINSSKLVGDEYEGIGFAIAMNDAKPIVDSLIQYGYIADRVKLGITYQEITQVTSEQTGLPVGLSVQAIDQTCDVANSGLQRYDIITQMNGKDVSSTEDVAALLKGMKPGDEVTMTVYRQSTNSLVRGTTETFKAKLESAAQASTSTQDESNNADSNSGESNGSGGNEWSIPFPFNR